MNNPMQQMIEAIAKEKGIEPDVIITAIEDAVLTASRKHFKPKSGESEENLKTKFNKETGQVDLLLFVRLSKKSPIRPLRSL